MCVSVAGSVCLPASVSRSISVSVSVCLVAPARLSVWLSVGRSVGQQYLSMKLRSLMVLFSVASMTHTQPTLMPPKVAPTSY